MNYDRHYNLLIERAKTRNLSEHYEIHHIIPRCIGGSDAENNLVKLTYEEHYLAHQLLVKIYPNNNSLVYAAVMMTVNRPSNKVYGWLKRLYHTVCKERIGNKNPSYGRSWYHDPDTLKNGKFLLENVPQGWIKGRVPKKEKEETKCKVCNQLTGGYMAKFCDEHRKEVYTKNVQKVIQNNRVNNTIKDAEKFTYAITTSKNWSEAIRKAGYKTDGYSRTRLKRFAKENNISLMGN